MIAREDPGQGEGSLNGVLIIQYGNGVDRGGDVHLLPPFFFISAPRRIEKR